MGTADVGIYRAYSAGSISIAMALFAMFNAVFFPTASKYEKKGAIFERLNKLMPYFGGLGVPMTVLCVFILLKFYGAEYPFDLGLAILFGVAGVVAFINGCYAWLMASVGQRGIMVTTSGALICALTNVVLNILLIPLMGLVGAVISTIVSYILYTCLLFMKRKLIQGE
jgi:O-antigen/teichoic acid export membrane protein